MSDNINNGFPVPEEPITREEQYLSAIAQVTPATQIPEEPLTRIEAYLDKIVENGGGGGGGFVPTQAQLDAMNSGIDSTKVEQIETNKTNILLSLLNHADMIHGQSFDCNTVVDNSIYRLSKTNNTLNLPANYPTDNTKHWLVTLVNTLNGNANVTQAILDNTFTQKWRRYKTGSQAWAAWSDITNSNTRSEIVECGAGKTYTRLRDAIAKGVELGCTVVVYAGTYDLTSEFASEISAAVSGQTGIPLSNGVHVKFMAGAYVTAVFDTFNSWAYSNFSPFYTVGDFTLENAHIVAKNTRYCVHDEKSGSGTYTVKYINCHMEYTSTATTTNYIQCIGGGLGLHGTILIDGGYYKSYTTVAIANYGSAENSQVAISYHNGAASGCDGKIIIRNVYLADRGFIKIGSHGVSTIKTPVQLCNNSFGLPIIYVYEDNNDLTAEIQNFNINAFNNHQRNTTVQFSFDRLISIVEGDTI